jgi:VCBS repeat-containing protein
MANYELVALVEGTPQLRAPTASDSASLPGSFVVGAVSTRALSVGDIRGNVTFGNNANYFGTLSYDSGTGFVDIRSEDGGFSFTRASGNIVSMALDVNGNWIQEVNGTAPALAVNSTMTLELTSNTALKLVVRGTDGVTRSVTLTLA